LFVSGSGVIVVVVVILIMIMIIIIIINPILPCGLQDKDVVLPFVSARWGAVSVDFRQTAGFAVTMTTTRQPTHLYSVRANPRAVSLQTS
jgi:hypothetical protein